MTNFGELALPISIFHSDNATAIVAGLIGGVHRARPRYGARRTARVSFIPSSSLLNTPGTVVDSRQQR